ncbi:site-2 protease family protein [Ktedonosporobacter rubrisoli]|uniref:Site-2 protease family protein n=1 Tax=Ktedonosporobacter rubrisoli TaxID=2509675 RepID=A0A4P6K3W4_KTERU|nr:site-2 protease family protein [Ktedonosporobacter rubrisoli]QBD82490.1 site-2 protease family protein [Ktedonosporobacter rubrisoli]
MDYAHPDYYQQPPEAARFMPPQNEALTEPPNYSDNAQAEYSYMPVKAYRGPADIESYTAQMSAEAQAAQNGAGEKKKRKGLAGIGGVLLAAVAWLLKLKGLVFLLKFGWAGISALISIVIYATFLGWPFAIGLVAMFFIHEMGHAIVMKLKGIPMGAMIFIPMLGAAVTMRNMPQNARDEAEVGIAGPLAGAIAASVCLAVAEINPHSHAAWAPLAYLGFFLNLFNLIPVVPFDGGRVLAAIDRRIWIIGFIALLAFQIWSWFNGNPSLWLLLIVIMAATQLWSRGTASGNASYYQVPVGTRIILTLLYFGLVAVLALGMSMAHALMPIGTHIL